MNSEDLAATAAYLFRTEKRNCAEAVVGALQKVSGKDPEVTENLSECGFGGAPQGLCGAVYAAQLVLPEAKKDAINRRFLEAAGSLLCEEIRKMRRISCTACVKLAATMLEKKQ